MGPAGAMRVKKGKTKGAGREEQRVQSVECFALLCITLFSFDGCSARVSESRECNFRHFGRKLQNLFI